ncbi:olfactory receptor 14A16-like [Pogona vitticeps]|nr:olfactory receptor 14A16-like [Pogona vitticeps]
MSNLTSISTFLLLAFSDVRELQILSFFLFLALYLMAVTGNLLIIVSIIVDNHLHTPMYFFLLNLAMIDLGFISVIVPKIMVVSLMDDRSISYSGCVAQVFFYLFFASSDFVILIIMAHDRHIAICNPLEYDRIMHKGTCLEMVAIGWLVSVLYALLHTCGTFANTFCSNCINQFFCEIPHLLKLSCSEIYLAEVGLLALSCGVGLGCFVFIIITYLKIFAAVLKIPSVLGQKKALSTCIPHLTVVSVYLLTGVFVHVIPPSDASSALDVASAVMYVIIPPTLNPFIYSMRNNEIRAALCKFLKLVFSSTVVF